MAGGSTRLPNCSYIGFMVLVGEESEKSERLSSKLGEEETEEFEEEVERGETSGL